MSTAYPMATRLALRHEHATRYPLRMGRDSSYYDITNDFALLLTWTSSLGLKPTVVALLIFSAYLISIAINGAFLRTVPLSNKIINPLFEEPTATNDASSYICTNDVPTHRDSVRLVYQSLTQYATEPIQFPPSCIKSSKALSRVSWPCCDITKHPYTVALFTPQLLICWGYLRLRRSLNSTVPVMYAHVHFKSICVR